MEYECRMQENIKYISYISNIKHKHTHTYIYIYINLTCVKHIPNLLNFLMFRMDVQSSSPCHIQVCLFCQFFCCLLHCAYTYNQNLELVLACPGCVSSSALQLSQHVSSSVTVAACHLAAASAWLGKCL